MDVRLFVQIASALLAGTAFFLFLAFVMGTISEIVFWISMGTIGVLAFFAIPGINKKFSKQH